MKRPILNHTRRGEWVYDPFLGSGTTLVAAEVTERKCCALELEPAQSVAIRGWLARRLTHVDAGRSHITVGHDDLAAWL